jgi:transcriptional regulator of heat shock response
MQLTTRNITILKIIIEEYLKNWEVLGSKLLLSKFDLWVSSATVRWDMAKLEKMNLVFQPYASAGRIPTSSWIRAYIDYLMTETPSHFLNENNIELWNNIKNISDYIYNITNSLSSSTEEISFFSIPKSNILWYSWISSFIKKNKKNYLNDSLKIVEMIEDRIRFMEFLNNFILKTWINLFIWEENNLNYLKDFSIIIKPIIVNNEKWYIWIIGNLQQNYSFNISALRGIL